MAKVSFTVSARTAKLIGQENFATAEGAIVELVKNSYDADAKNCVIIFDNHDKNSEDNSIYIIDNGSGLTSLIILNHWMKIGTDDKLENYLSKGGRVKTGAKGIGRFALDRLSLYSEMFTVSEKEQYDENDELIEEPEEIILEGSIWSVKWSEFDKIGAAINDVQADLDEAEDLDLKQELLAQFSNFEFIQRHIANIDFETGTILKLTSLKDNWDETSIKSLFDNLEVLIPPQEQPEFDVHLFSTKTPEEYGQVNSAYYDDFDYKLSAKYLDDNEKNIVFTISRNELNVSKLKEEYSEVFEYDLMKKYPYTLDVFEDEVFTFKRSINELSGFSKNVDEKLIDKIGKFDFTFYFLKNKIDPKDKKRFPYKNISPANRKSWLEKFGGVKIFRDDFRVRPYGENGQDWLGLGERQGRSPGGPGQKLGGYRIGSNQIAGTVNISRIENASFQDKSGREGIQENDVFELFKNLLIEIISVFERDRNVIMYNLAELAKKRFKDEEDKAKAQAEADRILKETEEEQDNKGENNKDEKSQSDDNGDGKSNNDGPTEAEKILAQATKIYEQELEEKDEEIRLLRGLASVGLIISSFAHELHSLRSRLIPRTDFLYRELKKYITKKDLQDINKQDDPFYMLQLIKEEDLKLKHWLDYSLNTLKRDKRERTNLNIGEYFERYKNVWGLALKQRKVKINLNGSNDASNIIRAFEVDLDAIFNNLLSNSLTAFKQKNGNYQREVSIYWKSSDEFVEIVFEDNGSGIADEYKGEPRKIFEYNESSKRDRKGNKIGTGMGLYIVSLVIEDYNKADIEILPSDDGFKLKVLLPKRK